MTRSYRSVIRQMIHYLLRPHTGIPRAPITSIAAWRDVELQRDVDWMTTLDRAEIEELEAANRIARASGKPVPALTAVDYPLPTLHRRIKQWAQVLADGRGVQVLRGIPVQSWTVEDCERFFFCFGLHMGIPGAQNRFNEILGHVRSEGLSYNDPSVRGYRTTAHLSYHCDAADVVGLLCLRTAKSGGRSRFVSSITVWNELFARRPDLAERLFQPMELDTRGDGGLNFFALPPCRYFEGQLRTFYHADYFRSAEQHRGAHKLLPAERELLDVYDEIASTPGNYVEMDFAPGDIQLLSNHTVLHARTSYVDHDDPALKRHLLRLWLSLPRAPSLRERPSMIKEGLRLLGALAVGRLRDRATRPKV